MNEPGEVEVYVAHLADDEAAPSRWRPHLAGKATDADAAEPRLRGRAESPGRVHGEALLALAAPWRDQILGAKVDLERANDELKAYFTPDLQSNRKDAKADPGPPPVRARQRGAEATRLPAPPGRRGRGPAPRPEAAAPGRRVPPGDKFTHCAAEPADDAPPGAAALDAAAEARAPGGPP
ncbi:hypothetical protein JL722_12289 [Aureococcus anophagefferens]|nr:hypothetical protein JL722_12289 [Aureococcus anophagefferens]